MNDLLNIKSSIASDNSVVEYEYHSYSPYTNSFGHNDEIRIAVQNQDLLLDTHNSYLYIEARIARTAGAGTVALEPNPEYVPNFAAFLFSEIRFEINSVQVDQSKSLPWTSLLKNYCSLTSHESRYMRIGSWDLRGAVAIGQLSMEIPLNKLLGFFEDYKQALVSSKIELILIRSRTDTNCFHGAHNVLSVTLDKIQWYVPHVTVSDTAKLKILRQIESKQPIEMQFRSWNMHEYPTLPQTNKTIWQVKTATKFETPRFIIIGFQTNRNNVITANPSIFDTCDVTDLRVHLNSSIHPYENLKLDFANSKFANLYYMYYKFQESYYQRAHPAPYLAVTDFQQSPIYVFDVSRQNEAVKNSAIDVRVEITCSAQMPANTTAYCLIINESKVSYSPLTGIVTKHV